MTEREALENLLNYTEEDERRDYEEQDTEGQENHIYLSILKLRAYLARHPEHS